MKLQEKVINILEKMGYVELKSSSKKYRKFTGNDTKSFHFVGRNGAVRIGSNIGNSYSVSTIFKNMVE